MKRYLSGIAATIIAICLVAFTTPEKKPLNTFTFRYTPATYTQPQVQTNSNWVSGASLCAGQANKACQMEVTDTYTHLDANNNRVLNTTGNVIVIKAVLGVNGSDYVPNPSTSTGIPSAIDKR
ncbi:MAG TPA: hypothetical protein VFI29_11425 [Hanamia sp.]|nr:hypothetical protein [Hanamia sp.]